MVRKYFLLFSCILLFFTSRADNQPVSIHLDSIPKITQLDSCWKYKAGDDKAWSSPSFDDSKWSNTTLEEFAHGDNVFINGIKWFRLHIKVSPALFNKRFLLIVSQNGASEIYLNGNLVKAFNKVGDVNTEKPYDPADEIHYIQLDADTVQVIVVRFSADKVLKQYFVDPYFFISLGNLTQANFIATRNNGNSYGGIFLFTLFLTLSLFHLLLFLYYRKVLSNLYYSILAFLLAFVGLYPFLQHIPYPLFHGYVNEIDLVLFPLCFFLIVLLVHSIFKERYGWFFWVLVVLTIVSVISVIFKLDWLNPIVITQAISSSFRGVFMVIRAVRRKQPGAWIIATGFLMFLGLILGVFFFIFAQYLLNHGTYQFNPNNLVWSIMLILWVFSIPASMSIYLASDFARTNKHLVLQLLHVKQLSEQNIEKEREKQQLIERQKENLEIKVKEATTEILRQKDQLSEKNKEITDSINYARRIQTSILPEEDLLRDALHDYMVLYKPKDVVSGDFYWCHAVGDKAIFAVADCTGHGVPGAFMSMIGNGLLNEIVIGEQITEANTILDSLRSKLIITLQQSAQHITTRDGMDIALCVWNKKDNTLQFAGANNSLYLVSKNIAVNGTIKESARVKLTNEHLLEILPDKQPIGYQEDKMNEPFTKVIIQLHTGDSVFVTSDGYTDQFGGDRNKKFTSRRFRELIASLAGLPIAEQKVIMERTIEDWKGNELQTDDICVLGIKVS